MFFNYWGEFFVATVIIIFAIYIIYKKIRSTNNQCSSCGSCSKLCPRYKNKKKQR